MQKHFAGALTAIDIKQHISHHFQLAAGITELSIHFTYSPGHVDGDVNMLTLTVLDANGFRGAGHRHAPDINGRATHHVDIGVASATPGYIPGPLPAGEWTVFIDTHSILPDAPVTYTIDITADNAGASCCLPEIAPKPIASVRQGRGWFRGDLHAHTLHSDATWDAAALAAFMRSRGMDFATLSDHNTVSGLREWDALTSVDFLTIGAIEMTTFYGHCLAWGTREWVNWQTSPGRREMADIAEEVTARGVLFAIAHPTAVGDPICTGCNWIYPDMQPGSARIVEVWNSYWTSDSNNDDAVKLWYTWLNQGYRMVATAGTDAHGAWIEPAEFAFNTVYADGLNEAAILQAIRLGHLFISAGPSLELTGQGATGMTAMMGDLLPGDVAQVHVQWDHCNGDERLNVIADGRELFSIDGAGVKGSYAWTLNAREARWCNVELRDRHNHIRALTNPIFMHQGDAIA